MRLYTFYWSVSGSVTSNHSNCRRPWLRTRNANNRSKVRCTEFQPDRSDSDIGNSTYFGLSEAASVVVTAANRLA